MSKEPKMLYSVSSTFTAGKESWDNAPIAVIAGSAEEARDEAPRIIIALWPKANIIKIGDARMIMDFAKKEEDKS